MKEQSEKIVIGPMTPLRRLFLEYVTSLGSLRTIAAIRDHLLKVVFAITAAERAAVFVNHTLTVRGRENRDGSVSINRGIVDRVFKSGPAVLINEPPTSILCVPMDTIDNRVGVIYAESSDPQKPLNEVNHDMLTGVGAVAAMAFEHASVIEQLQAHNSRLEKALDLQHDLIGESAPMAELQKLIAKAAPADSTVLIQGESGTGKELVARALHRNSTRSHAPFVAVNCAALAESLLESELFGHERGAFTGATAQKKGQFELAAGGTLFLDEVGELAPSIQAKLLRALQEKEIKRVGGEREIKVDVRLLAATNRSLDQAVEANQFRADLLYRLKVISIKTPPLRSRREDISTLTRHFVEKYQRKNGRMVRGVSREAEAVLDGYDWPGNVRELQNVIERAMVLGSGDVVACEDLPEELLGASSVAVPLPTYKDETKRAQRILIERALARTGGDCTKAAEMIDLNPKSLYKMVRSMKLTHLRK